MFLQARNCNESINMGKQLYYSEYIQKTLQIYLSRICISTIIVIKYMVKHRVC